ncbi:hypothetical protein BDA99DRAFT_559251 [Phascolomyces articulosus]|uniref:Uncharacterized protein n=1 Tax=Phascolomyces articulosus TaxID=60185 RepID=A0AAD5PGN7_9FUNG|nr:hypothetical protein BDA99DRAFT_559251 [Phascolomyces articulosus]
MPTFSKLLRDVGSTLPLITTVTVLHFLGLALPLPVLPAQLGTSVPVVESRVKVVTPRPMTHCLDIEEGHGLGEEVPFFVKIRQEGYEAHQARLERLASVQSTKVVGSIAPAVALLPRRHRRFRMMASVLRPMTPLNRELPQTSRAVLGDSDAVYGRVPEVAPPTVRDTEMEDLVKQFESMHLCSDPVSPQASVMSLDSSDETPFMVEPFVEDTSAAAGLGDSNVVPIYMPVEVEAIADDDVDTLGGDSSTSFVVVDEYAPGNVQQEENPFNLQHVVEPLVDPAVVLNVPASGLATASMRMISGLATASMSSSPADVSVVDRSVSTTQNDNQDFDFTFSFSAPATTSHSVPASSTPMSSTSSSDGDYVPRPPTPTAPSSSASFESGDYIPRSPSPSVIVVSEEDEQELRYSSEGELPPDHLDILDLM